ncbi:uncharacterized protein LOC110026087 [Phalaenopsis equestris]|uniref:uncharacterized protein LOC110026087 n=1 Tax=Phalaenopsis equestris TaxID=78828 RepID=UPI0009E1B0D8|nr:uncharacterized protein LOC110026087 [Phalaenopsis equestris]
MSQTNFEEEERQPVVPNLQFQALVGEMRRMMRVELEQIHERLERVEGGIQQRNPRNVSNQQRERVPLRGEREEDEEYYAAEFDEENNRDLFVERRRYGGQARDIRNRDDNSLTGIKMRIPSFQGKNNPKAYLQWEKKMELVFDCHNYSKIKKVKLAAIEFSDYAIVWWDQLMLSKRRNRERPIETWEEIKVFMRKRFVPSHHYR